MWLKWKKKIKDELNNEKAENFWKNKIHSSKKWIPIKEICGCDSATAAELLTVAGFACSKDNLQEIYEMDFPMRKYKIPNYCINDPYFEKELVKVEPDRKKNKIIIFLKLCEEKEKFNFDDDISGKEIKEEFAKRKKLNFETYSNKIRLFFGGNEIHDNEFLYQHF